MKSASFRCQAVWKQDDERQTVFIHGTSDGKEQVFEVTLHPKYMEEYRLNGEDGNGRVVGSPEEPQIKDGKLIPLSEEELLIRKYLLVKAMDPDDLDLPSKIFDWSRDQKQPHVMLEKQADTTTQATGYIEPSEEDLANIPFVPEPSEELLQSIPAHYDFEESYPNAYANAIQNQVAECLSSCLS